jgi:multidrug resistance efflux pump
MISNKIKEISKEYDVPKIIKYASGLILLITISIILFFPKNKDITVSGFMYSKTDNLTITSPISGKITSVNVNEGDIIEENQLLMMFFNEKTNKDLESAWFLLWDTQTEIAKLKAYLEGSSEIDFSKVESNSPSNVVLNGLKNQKIKELTSLIQEKKNKKEELIASIEEVETLLKDINKKIKENKYELGQYEDFARDKNKELKIGSDEKKDFIDSYYKSKQLMKDDIKKLFELREENESLLKDLVMERKTLDKTFAEKIAKKLDSETTNELIIKTKLAEITSRIKEEQLTSKYNGKVVKIKSVANDVVSYGTELMTIIPKDREFEIITFFPKDQINNIKNNTDAVVKINNCGCEIDGKIIIKNNKEENFDNYKEQDLIPVYVETSESSMNYFKEKQWELGDKENVTITIKNKKESLISEFFN